MGALKLVLLVSEYPGPCVQAGAVMLTVAEVASEVCGLYGLAIVLLVLTHRGESLVLLVLEIGITVGASVMFEIEGVETLLALRL